MRRSLLTYLLTYSIEQSPPWEANRFSTSQEITKFMETWGSSPHLQEPATSPCSEPNKSSPYLPHLLKTLLNIIPPSTPGSSNLSPSFRFPYHYPACTSPVPIRATYPAHLILLNLMTRILFGEQYRTVSCSRVIRWSWLTIISCWIFLFYVFITCNWVDTRWQGSLQVTLARTMKFYL